MEKHDDFELQVIDVSAALSSTPPRPPHLKLGHHPRPTAADSLAALRATKGAGALIERIPALANLALWNEIASFTPCASSGAAYDEPLFWGCDFFGGVWDLTDAKSNCIAYFAGHEEIGGIHKPNPLNGRVWCYLDTPSAGYYLFTAQVQTYPDQYFSEGYFATLKFGINSQPLGLRALFPGSSVNLPFVVSLPAGLNRFEINQHTGGSFFRSVTAYQLLDSSGTL